LASEVAVLHGKKHQVILVSSGAIGAGMDEFGWTERPTILKDKQAAAAVGQVSLMEAYKSAFARHGIVVAQMLLTKADLDDHARCLNARHTLSALLERGVVPVVNENDTVATEEIQLGDNDSLAAQVAAKVGADKLFLLTDVQGLLMGGKVLPEVLHITPEVEALVHGGTKSPKSVGGMASKIKAARLATSSGVEVWIASGRSPGLLEEILDGRGIGTRFHPTKK
jgi:glutamate 5-kinase